MPPENAELDGRVAEPEIVPLSASYVVPVATVYVPDRNIDKCIREREVKTYPRQG